MRHAALRSAQRPSASGAGVFGRDFANTLKRRRSKPGNKWFLDEVFIRIRGKQHDLWRAVDQNGVVFDVLVQNRAPITCTIRTQSA